MQRILLLFTFVVLTGLLVGLGCSRATEESAGETLESARTTVDHAATDLRDHASAAGERAERTAEAIGDDVDEGLESAGADLERGVDEAGADLAAATAEGADRVEREARASERAARAE